MKQIALFTDGSTSKYTAEEKVKIGSTKENLFFGAWAYAFIEEEYKESANHKNLIICQNSGVGRITTSQRSELNAIKNAFEDMVKNIDFFKSISPKVNIYTDSQYAIFCFERYKKWLSETNNPEVDIPNYSLVSSIHELKGELEKKGFSFSIKHVAAHTGIPMNEFVDSLAQKTKKDFKRSL